MNAGGYIKKKDYGWVIPVVGPHDEIVGYEPSTEGATATLSNGVVLRSRKVLNKMPCDDSLYFLYRPGGGNPVTHVMNNKNNNRIIGRFNSTAVYPNIKPDDQNTKQKFWFMNRQNKTVDRMNERNTKIVM